MRRIAEKKLVLVSLLHHDTVSLSASLHLPFSHLCLRLAFCQKNYSAISANQSLSNSVSILGLLTGHWHFDPIYGSSSAPRKKCIFFSTIIVLALHYLPLIPDSQPIFNYTTFTKNETVITSIPKGPALLSKALDPISTTPMRSSSAKTLRSGCSSLGFHPRFEESIHKIQKIGL